MCRALALEARVVAVEMPRTSIGIAALSCALAIIAVIVVIVTVSHKKKASLGAYGTEMVGGSCLVR